MSKQFLRFDEVTFGYESSAFNLFEKISFQVSNGWTGIVGPNGAGKSTILKLSCGILNNSSGTIEAPFTSYYNEQRTDTLPDEFYDFINSFDKKSVQLIGKLNIKPDWIERWSTLSHGERKRVQIACAVWKEPDFLAVDEPTNHLDEETKEMIAEALMSFQGVGMIVSHDRELLEKLCGQILFVEPPGIDLRNGKLSEAIEQRKLENESALKQADVKRREIGKMEKEYLRRSRLTDKSKKKSSKRLISKKTTMPNRKSILDD